MKRFIAVLLVCLMAVQAQARVKVGLLGGVSPVPDEYGNLDLRGVEQYHAGLFVYVPLPLGFALQPSVQFQSRSISTKLSYNLQADDDASTMLATAYDIVKAGIGYVEVPVQVQWGMPCDWNVRPYVFAEPFIGYAVTNSLSNTVGASVLGYAAELDPQVEKNRWDYVNRLEYGVGAGLGLTLFKTVSLSAKYYWNFGSLYNGEPVDVQDLTDVVVSNFVEAYKDDLKISGVSLTLQVMF